MSLSKVNWEKIIMSWITLDFFKNKTNVLLRGVIFQFRDQISKKVAGHFEEHKKLGRQPKFQKFLATGGLVIPRRRLIGGEKFEIYLIFINFFYRKL